MTETRRLTDADLADDTVLHDYWSLTRRAELEGRAGAPFWSFQEFAGAIRSPDSGTRRDFYVTTDGNRSVAAAMLETWPHDNRDKAYVEVVVEPDARRRGLGRSLAAVVEDRVRADGRTVLMCRALTPPGPLAEHGGVRFAESLGFTVDNVEVVRHLDLPVAVAEIQAWRVEAASGSSTYSIETFVDHVPTELRPSLVALHGQLVVDAPTGSVEFEERDYPVERLAERQASVTAMGRSLYQTFAVTEDREVVAYTSLVVPLDADTSADVFQWGTLVAREHRGHRLGLTIKAANLDAVQRDHPDVRCVITQNAEANDHMVAINARMGFEVVELSVELVKRW